jgi:hypothetical protein
MFDLQLTDPQTDDAPLQPLVLLLLHQVDQVQERG